ncbi:hypothetical protein HMPREF1640_12855 [Prevotella sp. S7-1-8]|uniref:hypothetical protein n=1 Tax=Prevotella sp. S7-1-8 TaxID=1284775 RepID=UPI0005102224|nr:hypothetical protein [Prevotella sp. S7-1-8]KGF14657.1 hypothetical protein HMPREF1640_12855 [Prevotella sp. S7-1-8]
MKNSILLIGGAVLTALFMIFPSLVFEMADSQSEFANEMYNENHYFVVAVISSVMAWGVAALFYYVINSVSFSRWYHWLISLLAVSIVASVVNYIYLDGALSIDYSGQLLNFSIIDFVVTAVLFTIASFAIRWWSGNCRHTPIPE